MRTDQVVPDTALTQMLNKDKVTITSLSKSFIRSHLETISNLTIIDTKSQTTTVTKHRIPAQNYLPNRLGNFINFVEHTTRPYGQSQFPTKKELIMGIDGVSFEMKDGTQNDSPTICLLKDHDVVRDSMNQGGDGFSMFQTYFSTHYGNSSAGNLHLMVVKLKNSDLTEQGKASDKQIWEYIVAGSNTIPSYIQFKYLFVRSGCPPQTLAHEIAMFMLNAFDEVRKAFGWKEGDEVPMELNAMLTMDGAGDVLNAILKLIASGLAKKKKIQIIKWAAATTHVDQQNDVSPVHRIIHQLLTKANRDSSACKVFKQRVQQRGLESLAVSGTIVDPDENWEEAASVVGLKRAIKTEGHIRIRKSVLFYKAQARLQSILITAGRESNVALGYHDIGFGKKPNIMKKLVSCKEFTDLNGDAQRELLSRVNVENQLDSIYFQESRDFGRIRESMAHGPGGCPPSDYAGRDGLKAINRHGSLLLTHGHREVEIQERAAVAAQTLAAKLAGVKKKEDTAATKLAADVAAGKVKLVSLLEYGTFEQIPGKLIRMNDCKQILASCGIGCELWKGLKHEALKQLLKTKCWPDNHTPSVYSDASLLLGMGSGMGSIGSVVGGSGGSSSSSSSGGGGNCSLLDCLAAAAVSGGGGNGGGSSGSSGNSKKRGRKENSSSSSSSSSSSVNSIAQKRRKTTKGGGSSNDSGKFPPMPMDGTGSEVRNGNGKRGRGVQNEETTSQNKRTRRHE